MEDENAKTLHLLQQWNGGDEGALGELVERDLPWIRKRVHDRLGEKLRERAETVDFVQDALVEVMRYGPRFELSDRQHFRNLLAKIVENVLRDKAKWWGAQRRAICRERPIPGNVTITLDPAAPTEQRPSMVASRNEKEAMLRLALELLDPEDREVLVLRQWRDKSFAEIAEELGLREDTARMRFTRALPRLAEKVRLLEEGELGSLLRE